jgi:addiction module HigA family antidote
MAADTVMAPVHPGEILLEEFLKPLAVSQYQLAKEIGVPARRINEIVHGQRRISADTALRLARFFGTSERFWINLQSHYDLEIEKTGSATRSMASTRSRPPADRPGKIKVSGRLSGRQRP